MCERERRPGEYVHVAGTDSRCKLARVRRRVFSDCADGWFVHGTKIFALSAMPNWDVSLVTDMSGWTGSVHEGFGGKSTFNADISKWDTGRVTNMLLCFIKLLRSTKTLGVGTQRKIDMQGMFQCRFCVQPRHWELEHRASDDMSFNMFYACVQPRHWKLEHSASD